MLSVAPNFTVRSSLDEMLETLQRRDESEKLHDVPPALPRRAVSRSRPPSAKRRLPVSSEADGTEESSEFCVKKGGMRGHNKIGGVEGFRQQVQQGTPEVQNGLHDLRHFHELNGLVITFQSYVRGEIARKKYSVLLGLKNQDIRENVDHHPEMLPLVVEGLQKRVSMVESTLQLKEKENASLREQVQQYEARWSEFEAKVKSNEETWQKQIASLQMALAAAAAAAQRDGVKEFEARKESLENERRAVVYASPIEKFRRLKRMVKAWTKEYKVRVRDSNTKIHSVGMGHSDAADKHWKTWWGKKSKRP